MYPVGGWTDTDEHRIAWGQYSILFLHGYEDRIALKQECLSKPGVGIQDAC